MKKIPLLLCLSATMIVSVSAIAVYKKFFATNIAYFKDCGGNCTQITSDRFSFETLQAGNVQAKIYNKTGNFLRIYIDNQCTEAAQFIECATN